MVKSWILFGYAVYFWYLWRSGDLNKFINMKYAYMIYIAIGGFLLLAVMSFINHSRKPGKTHDHGHDHDCDDHHCGHDHHKKPKPYMYFFYLLPLLLGFDVPVATLDSSMVITKGIQFPTMQQGTQWNKWNQVLQPDSSQFYSPADYNAMMLKNLSDLENKQELVLNDQNYMSDMETLYKNQSNFQGKTIELDGFVYNDRNLSANHSFLLRFGMVHCILDSGVYGVMVEVPTGASFKNDQWYHIKGTLGKAYYAPIEGMIPCVTIQEFKPIAAPKEPYVYRNT